jgi:hypothetical protein
MIHFVVYLAVIEALLAVWLAATCLVTMARSAWWQKRLTQSAEFAPAIRTAIADYVGGAENFDSLEQCVRASPRDVADELLAFRQAVAGAALDRLCNLTIELTLLQRWLEDAESRDIVARRNAFRRLAFACAYEPCRRQVGDRLAQALSDTDREVRLTAAAAMVRTGQLADLERVFRLALTETLLVRMSLGEVMRPHAYRLCERVVPEVLRSSDVPGIVATLELLRAWERAVPIKGLAGLMSHHDMRVRLGAYALAPLVAPSPEIENEVLAGLGDRDARIVAAAARAAARLRLDKAMPVLARCARTGVPPLLQVAASALAEMPPSGWSTLQELRFNPNPATAAAAGAALERARRKAGA